MIAGGRESSALPKYDDTYQFSSEMGGSSAAAPAVAGAAANLKDFLLTIWSSAFTNDVGNMYAAMLLMGDSQTESGVYGVASPPDPVWGVGRMRMRMFTAAGMDAPWRARACSRLLADGELDTCSVNPDSAGTNTILNSDVDRFKTALWWYEPNIESTESPAEIEFSLWRDAALYAVDATHHVGTQRFTVPGGAGSHLWSLFIYGTSIPASSNASYYYGLQKRKIHVALYWEDSDRDDGDGPSSGIQ